MFNNLRLFYFVISITFVFLLAQSSSANITNGTFDTDDEGNIIDWNTEGAVTTFPWLGGMPAQLAPDGVAANSILSQSFFLEENSNTLSFDVSMDITPGTPETDVFTASLDGTSFYSWSSDTEEPYGKDKNVWPYVWLTNENVWLTNVVDNVVVDTYASRTVNLDVSGLLTGTYTLVFKLNNDYTDTVDTYIYIDNVNVSGNFAVAVVPAPGAMLLGCIGAAIVGVFRRVKSTC